MLLWNIDSCKGHVNGPRYIVSEMTRNTLNINLATGAKAGNTLCLPRMPYEPGDDSFPGQVFLRTKFPARVCFGITTNKTRGQYFGEALRIDLQYHEFSHGQLYVDRSKATRSKNIHFLCPTFPMN